METVQSPYVTLTSPPRLSNRHPGYQFCYIDEATPEGRACGICIPVGIAVNKGDRLPRERVHFDPEMGASIYMVGDQPSLPQNAPVPGLPTTGWQPDSHPAANPRPGQYGMRGRAYRRQSLAEASTVAASLPNDFVEQLDLATRGYLYIAKRIGTDETPRPDIAKSLAITVLIQWFKKNGTLPAGFDEEDMGVIH